ncbi:hypothetical protein ACMUMQ_10340 [Marinomonas sp. 2405UD66-6]|uniref:hypothetical protein n=1 Tax=Marinomonas sp. 2405UD66-6 TaxID=3391834 RepID=UPI0039C90723
MSGSLPHSIAVSSHTLTGTTTPGYTTFDLRSDEDTNMAALNARNAKASSDLIVTISEEGQALSQDNRKKLDEIEDKESKQLIEELEEEFDESELIYTTSSTHNQSNKIDDEALLTGGSLDQTV